jgi:ribosomal protein S12 methylthiotransferase
MKKTRIGILSLGCPRNLVDSENILGRLQLKGYPLTEIEQADVAIVNTCGFIEDAKKESIEAILDLLHLKQEGRLKKIIVYGCLAQRYQQALSKEFPEVDAFVGRVSLNHSRQRFALTPKHYGYLKICDGCINNCSYCAIPAIKGRFSSSAMEDVISRARQMNAEGVSELNIIGQDITGYGLDIYKKERLVLLLRRLLPEIPAVRWVRLLYLYPERICDELLNLIKTEPKLCKYLDIPLQHINGRILRLMHRDSSPLKIHRLIEKIRKKIPEAALRTSIIVGFPSETEKEFQELLRFIKEARFERLGAFIYSREEGTPAYSFREQIPAKIKIERFNAVMATQQEVSRLINQEFLGRELEVMIDESQRGYYLGRSRYDAPEVDGSVFVYSSKVLKPGDIIRVRVNDTLEYDLVGERII